jgi:ribonuclease J
LCVWGGLLTTVTFLGGIDEIGGNCFLVEDKGTRLLLDFGMRFSVRRKYFEEYLKPRSSAGLIDVLTLGLVPDKLEFYRKDLLEMIGKKSASEPYLDGVLLSHIHYDHSANISFLDERVPVYTSQITALYAKVLTETGQRNIETELYDFKPRPLTNPRMEATPRIFKTFDGESKFKVGSITVHSYPVDHSVAGATAFLLECSDSTLLYTGDLRFHGPLGSHTRGSIEKIAEQKPDVMLCEGTRVDETTTSSENDVKTKSLQTAGKCKGLIVADFAPRDVFRLSTFHAIAKELGRKLLIMKQDAYLINQLREVPLLGDLLPPIDDASILVYVERKGSGTYRDVDYRTWEREFLSLPNAVQSDYVQKNQSKIMACMGFFDINELIDMGPKAGSIYIESTSEPHNEEQEIDVERLNNWLDFFGLAKFHFHSSGHASATDVKSLIQTAQPKCVIPIHTEQPKLFRGMHTNVRLVQTGQTIDTCT